MLFHSFSSQEERRKFGGSDFIELSYCKLKFGTPIEEILSNDVFWSNSSLYIYGDDWDHFYKVYGEIITGGTYFNLKTGCLDCCGINYFSAEQMKAIIAQIKKKQPEDFQILLEWLEKGTPYNGFYVLGE